MFIRTEKLSYTYMAGSSLAVEDMAHVRYRYSPGQLYSATGRSGKSTLLQHFNVCSGPSVGASSRGQASEL